MSKIKNQCLSLCLLLTLLSLSSFVQAFEMKDPELFYEGQNAGEKIKYACTGVGEARQDTRWEAYPLKLTFTASGTAYISDVATKIKDEKGTLVFEAKCTTPWLVVDLKPGSYQVEALVVDKYTQQAKFQVKAGVQTSQVIRFPEIKSGN